MKKSLIAATTLIIGALALVSCDKPSKVASKNLSKAADNFEVNRRIVFYNGITDSYVLTIEGRCSIEDQKIQLEVTCKLGEGQFRKHFLGLSDNVTYFAEQLQPIDVSVFHHRVFFRPQTIVPDIDFQGSTEELTDNPSEASQKK